MGLETGEETTTTERERGHLPQLLAIGAIVSVLGVGLGILIDWFPEDASEQAGPIDTLWDVLLICSVPIFVLVATTVLYCVWRFRMKPGEEGKDGPPIHGHTRLEIVWTAIPAVMLVALCSYAYAVLLDIEDAQGSRELPVRVVGEQFTWTFYYAGPGGKQVASPRLYLPKDRPVHFTVQSKDVIHDFWVPAFRMKIDAVRGVNTELRVTPTREGEFPVVCAELCGIGHATMRQTAIVVPPDEFDRWLADRAAGGGAGGGEQAAGEAPDGKALFAGTGCGSCHALADAGSTGGTGSDLDEALADADEAFIEESIVKPDAEIEEGFKAGIMPSQYGEQLQPAEIDALVKYLAEVTG